MNVKDFTNLIDKYLSIDDNKLCPIFIEGYPGIGKTEIIMDLAIRHNYKTLVLHLGTISIEYFSGLPTFIDDKNGNKSTLWSIPEIVTKCNENEKTLLFLDDIHLTDITVIKILFELLTNRTIHDNKINDNVKIIAAMNSTEFLMGSTISELPLPIRNRIWKIEVTPSYDYWLEKYALKNDINPIIWSYLQFNTEYFCKPPKDDKDQFPTPRSWTHLSNYMNQGFELNHELAVGFIGKDASQDLINYNEMFLRFMKNLPSKYSSLNSYQDKISFLAFLTAQKDAEVINKYIDEIVKDTKIKTLAILLFTSLINDYEKVKNPEYLDKIRKFLNQNEVKEELEMTI